MSFFDSSYSFYKTPLGAVRLGKTVQFTICVPESFHCEIPHFLYQKDGEEKFCHIQMTKGQKQGSTQLFHVSFTPSDIGLYFYYFDLYVDYQKLFRGSLGQAVLTQQMGEAYQLTVFDPSFETPASVQGGILYQIFPDRFYESAPKKEMPFSDRIYRSDKDGLPFFESFDSQRPITQDYYGGDLKGIQEKLPYLASLGVRLLYLNPIFEAHANHRYNTANYLKVDPLLGTEKDFQSLCQKAKLYKIQIILDGVFSHTGSDSIYFNKEGRYPEKGAYHDTQSPYREWYDFSKQYTCGYKSWWGFETLPEVNEQVPSFYQFICGKNGVIDYWMKLGACGFRLDVADELPDVFIQQIRKAVKRHGNDKLLIGEVWEDATTKFSYSVRRTYLLGTGLDSVMNYPFRDAILNFLKGGNALESAEIITRICENYPAPALHTMMNFLSTHDTIRAITALVGEDSYEKDRTWQSQQTLSSEQYEHGITLMRLAFAMLYTLPGIPSIYYGDEIGMQGYQDPFNRAYFDWNSKETRLRALLKALGNVRKSTTAFSKGSFAIIHAKDGIFHYARHFENQTAEICINREQFPYNTVLLGHRITIPPLCFAIATSQTQGPFITIYQP